MRTIANVNITTDEWINLITSVNELLTAFSNEIVTANTTAGVTNGNVVVVGNTQVTGVLAVTTSLQGGTNAVSNTLSVPSALAVSNTLSVSGNATMNVVAAVSVASNTANIGGTVKISNNSIVVGNTSINATAIVVSNTSTTNLAVSNNATIGGTLAVTGNGSVANLSANAVLTTNVYSNSVFFASALLTTNTIVTNASTSYILDSFPVSTGSIVKYVVGMKGAANTLVYACELLTMFDASNTSYLTKYAELYNTAVLGSFDFTVNGSNAQLTVTPVDANTYNVTATRILQ